MSEPTSIHSTTEPDSRSHALQAQIKKLESLSHRPLDASALAQFDEETETLIQSLFGIRHPQLETYKYAKLGEAAVIVNLPESAQEESAQNVPRKAIQQRRQVLEACLSELRPAEEAETSALMGEDREDPPGMS
jgi:hypothetical protein